MLARITPAISIWLLLALPLSALGNQDIVVREFADHLKELIAASEAKRFAEVECVPRPRACVEAPEIQRIFGTPKKVTPFESIMRNPSLKIRIVGPYTREDEWTDSTYTVYFYDDTNSPFDENGRISADVGLRELGRTFLQTQVTVQDSKAYFHRVPFHLGAHHPYVSEYGSASPDIKREVQRQAWSRSR